MNILFISGDNCIFAQAVSEALSLHCSENDLKWSFQIADLCVCPTLRKGSSDLVIFYSEHLKRDEQYLSCLLSDRQIPVIFIAGEAQGIPVWNRNLFVRLFRLEPEQCFLLHVSERLRQAYHRRTMYRFLVSCRRGSTAESSDFEGELTKIQFRLQKMEELING